MIERLQVRAEHPGTPPATLVGSYSAAGLTAVVALHGASAGTRAHPLYEQLHRLLPSVGIGVATFDRRGEGESSGAPSVGNFDLQARDALAIASALDAERIGLWGFSQGGWVAPIAASLSDSVRFLVLVASTGVTPADQMRYATAEQMRRAGYAPEVIRHAVELRLACEAWIRAPDQAAGEELVAALESASHEPWWELTFLQKELPDARAREEWRAEMDFDPTPVFGRVNVPTLLFYGAEDEWSPVEASLRAWRLARGPGAEVVVIPGAAHDLRLPDGSLPTVYGGKLVEWCLRQRQD